MANVAYVNPVSNNLFKVSVGMLSDSGSSFQTIVKPSFVIKYTPSAPQGVALLENTSTPTNPGTGKWGYSNGYVYLGDALQNGETVLAMVGTESIFETCLTLANTPYFDVAQEDANYRTKIQRVMLMWLGAGEELRDVTITANDILPTAGSSATHYSLAPDVDGQPGTFVSQLDKTIIPKLESLKWLDSVFFWVKCVKPQNAPTGTFADITVNVQGTRVKYPNHVATLATAGYTPILLAQNDYYVLPFFRYVRRSGSATSYYFPYLYYDTSQQKLYLYVHNPSGNITDVHYIIQPVRHLRDQNLLTVATGSGTSVQMASSFFQQLVFFASGALNVSVSTRLVNNNFSWSWASTASYEFFHLPTSYLAFLGANLSAILTALKSNFNEDSTSQTASTTGYSTFGGMAANTLMSLTANSVTGLSSAYTVYAPFASSLSSTSILIYHSNTSGSLSLTNLNLLGVPTL